eukprot:3300744-Amphidinium_carterae.1
MPCGHVVPYPLASPLLTCVKHHESSHTLPCLAFHPYSSSLLVANDRWLLGATSFGCGWWRCQLGRVVVVDGC